MIAFFLAPIPAPQTVQPIADPVERRAVEQCRAGLARKVRGEVSELDLGSVHRSGPTLILKGTTHVLERPPVRPGEMTPTHVIAAPYSYECRVNGHRLTRIKASPL